MPTLWPNFAGMAAPRTMQMMLYDAAAGIDAQTNGKLDFFIDAVGVGRAGAVEHIRYNCYLRVPKNSYLHLLFQVTTPVAGPFPAEAVTPEGDRYPNIADEPALLAAIAAILQRERTKEIAIYLMSTVS